MIRADLSFEYALPDEGTEKSSVWLHAYEWERLAEAVLVKSITVGWGTRARSALVTTFSPHQFQDRRYATQGESELRRLQAFALQRMMGVVPYSRRSVQSSLTDEYLQLLAGTGGSEWRPTAILLDGRKSDGLVHSAVEGWTSAVLIADGLHVLLAWPTTELEDLTPPVGLAKREDLVIFGIAGRSLPDWADLTAAGQVRWKSAFGVR
jgi:hypothetical protein